MVIVVTKVVVVKAFGCVGCGGGGGGGGGGVRKDYRKSRVGLTKVDRGAREVN